MTSQNEPTAILEVEVVFGLDIVDGAQGVIYCIYTKLSANLPLISNFLLLDSISINVNHLLFLSPGRVESIHFRSVNAFVYQTLLQLHFFGQTCFFKSLNSLLKDPVCLRSFWSLLIHFNEF